MFESWSGYQNKKGAEGPFLVLEVWLTDEDIVRQNALAFWTPQAPRRGEPAKRVNQSWSGYQNNEGAEGPFIVLEVWLTDEDIVRQNALAAVSRRQGIMGKSTYAGLSGSI